MPDDRDSGRSQDRTVVYRGLPSGSHAPPPSNEVLQLAEVLRRRRWTVLTVLLSVLGAAALLGFLLPESYESKAVFLVTWDESGTSTPTLDVLQRVGSGRGVQTEAELVQSRYVAEAAVHYLGFSPVVGEDSLTSFQMALTEIQDRLEADYVGNESDLFEIRCSGPTAIEAQMLCDGVSLSYIELRTELERAEATAAAGFLAEQVDSAAYRLATAESELEDYRRTNGLIALDERAAAGTQQLIAMRAQREQLDAERSALVDLIQQVETDTRGEREFRDLASFPTFLQNPNVTQLLGSILELENQRENLALTRSRESPDIVALDTRISDLEQQIRRMAGSYERALATQIGSLDATLSTYGQRLLRIPEQQVRLGQLERRVELLDELYRFLDTRLREAEVAKELDLPSVQIVDPASLPLGPTFPNLPLTIGLGLMLGFIAGVSLALVQESLDTRFYGKSQLESGTGLSVLAMIPTVRRSVPLLPIAFVGKGETNDLGETTGSSGGTGLSSADVSKYAWDQTIAVEAFRSLAADLRFLGRDLPTGKLFSVAVTSAGPGEGKTFTACNLALAKADPDQRTLLIDADMRASGVSRFLGVSSGPGLHEVLRGTATPEQVIKTMSVDGMGTVQVLPAGEPTSRSAAILEQDAFETFVSGTRNNYDMLIIDTPPLNVITDAASIAAAVDAVLLVVRRNMTDREGLELTLERLERTGVPIVSVVLNDVALPKRYATYSYRYQ